MSLKCHSCGEELLEVNQNGVGGLYCPCGAVTDTSVDLAGQVSSVLHCADHELEKGIVKLCVEEESGIVVRYTSPGSAALMVSYIFAGRYKWSLRSVNDPAYVADRIACHAGEGI